MDDPIASEAGTLSRVLKANKDQHRRTPPYRAMARVLALAQAAGRGQPDDVPALEAAAAACVRAAAVLAPQMSRGFFPALYTVWYAAAARLLGLTRARALACGAGDASWLAAPCFGPAAAKAKAGGGRDDAAAAGEDFGLEDLGCALPSAATARRQQQQQQPQPQPPPPKRAKHAAAAAAAATTEQKRGGQKRKFDKKGKSRQKSRPKVAAPAAPSAKWSASASAYSDSDSDGPRAPKPAPASAAAALYSDSE